MQEKIESLLQKMTLEEKVSLLAGVNMWATPPIERLGIPAMKVSDGPNGARGGQFSGGVTAACFPAGISLGSTWNPELLEQVGGALAEEAQSKGAHFLLAPTVNIHRTPLNGRHFECYSEDPYLTARLAVAYIRGLQAKGVGATVKHYVCNDQEFERNTISSEVTERALREIYLPPFEAAVKEAGTWAVMSSYNRINGTYAGEHPYTLTDILRKEWGFEGIVMSDWWGTHSTVEAALAGLDLEMPGPPTYRGEKLVQAVKEGKVPEAVIDERVRNMLRAMIKSGVFELPPNRSEQAMDKPEHRTLIRRAGAEGIVLLKNEGGLLPLDPSRMDKIAIIGPNAKTAQIMGGGSAQVNAHYRVNPYEGIRAKIGDRMEVAYELGCTNYKMLPVADPAWFGEAGLQIAYFNNLDLSGEPVASQSTQSLEQMWLGPAHPQVNPTEFSARLSGKLIPPESGEYTFSLISAGLSRLFLDGKLALDNWTSQEKGEAFFGMGSAEKTCQVSLRAGTPAELVLEYSRQGATMMSALRLGGMLPVAQDSMERAVKLAREADVAVLFVGLSAEWDSEGFDRPDLELVGEQKALIERVAAVQKNTVVVLQNGGPVTLSWLNNVGAVLQAWYPGQEAGNAIADVLFGEVNPSGRLSQTWPVRLEDNPSFINYPGENGKVHYGEGIFVGYRYYEKKKIAPLFPFGYGLSYTEFEISNLRLSSDSIGPEETLTVWVDVTNTGKRAGQEVVQLYVSDPASRLVRPEKELKGFAKVHLEAGETKTVELKLDKKSLAYYDDLKKKWVAEAGEFHLLVGCSSQDIRASAAFTLTQSASFGGLPSKGSRFSLQSTLQELLADDGVAGVLDKHFPGMVNSPQISMALTFSLEQVAGFVPDIFTKEKLEAIAADLAALG